MAYLGPVAFEYAPRLIGQAPCGALRPEDVLVIEPAQLGLGRDLLIGGAGGPHYRVIDLSRLTDRVRITWNGPDCGCICDGADAIVFQGIEEIILPPCMRA